MNRTELFITRFYESINVGGPEQLSIESLSERMNLCVNYWEFTSEIINYKGVYKVFINEKLNEQQQWQDFGHEIGHFFWHGGNRNCMTHHFVRFQEIKSDYFAYHFCVPTFMLLNLEEVTVYAVMNLFNVEFDFALRRLEMYKSKVLERKTQNCEAISRNEAINIRL